MSLAFTAGARLVSIFLRVPSPLFAFGHNGLSKAYKARQTWQLLRAFTVSSAGLAKQLPPRRTILDSEIEESFLKGSGPGGQKINKTNSAVQLKHLPTGLVVKCQETRSRQQNRKLARRILGEKLEELELGEGARTRVKAREVARKKASKRKKSLRKYRKLEESKRAAAQSGGEEGMEDDAVDENEGLAGRGVEDRSVEEGQSKPSIEESGGSKR